MDNLTKIKINKINYYQADDMIKQKIKICKGSPNGRRLIDNINIPEENYIYASKQTGKWIISNGKSRKFDKVFVSASWLEKKLDEELNENESDSDDENNNNNELDSVDNNDDDNKITLAPGIIKLTKKEKMKDNSGNIIEIEVRGTRDHNNCYFKVYDIAKGFSIKRLDNTLTRKDRGYKSEIHYQYFNFKKTTENGYRKKLYLTFAGMEKVINCSRSIHIQNAMTARKWLSQFCVSAKFNSLILDSSKSSISNIGYAYCITSDKIDADKIGYWKGTKKDLISRYKTYYGDTVKIFCVKTMYPELLEKKCHQHFKKYKLSHELYDKSRSEEYKLFLKENKITPTEKDIYDNQQMTKVDVETLFTAHLGTQEQKNLLSSKLMGVSVDIVEQVFNKTSSTLPVIYLFTIGKVKDLRTVLDIDDEYDDECIVAKGGETIDLTRRIGEHNKTYGNMPGVHLSLKWYNYIDPQYTSKAETELFQVLEKMKYKFTHKKFKELIIFSNKDSKIIQNQFESIAKKYIGHIKEISDKLRDLENAMKISELEHANEKLKYDNEISHLKMQNEIIELKYKNEIMEKDKEIRRLKSNGSKSNKKNK
nr:hypothetical protein [Megavirus caiporensis]